jgi:hypothetical protein
MGYVEGERGHKWIYFLPQQPCIARSIKTSESSTSALLALLRWFCGLGLLGATELNTRGKRLLVRKWSYATPSWHDSFAPSAVCAKAFPPFSRDQTGEHIQTLRREGSAKSNKVDAPEPIDILVQTSSETPRHRKSMRNLYFDLHRTEFETRMSQHGLCVSCTRSPTDQKVQPWVHLDAMGGGHQRQIGDELGGGW